MKVAHQRITKLVAAAIALATLGLAFPYSAAADATDDAFSRALFAEGLNFAPQPLVVKRARLVCELFGSGMSAAEVRGTILNGSTATEGSSFSPRQATLFIAKAVQFYCPASGGSVAT